MCDSACESIISCCGTMCAICCKTLALRRTFLAQFLIYAILQGFNVATDAGLFVEIFQTRSRCHNLTQSGPMHCNAGNVAVTKSLMEDHISTLEILEYSMMIVMGIGGAIYIVHLIILLPNLCKHCREPDFEFEVESKQAPRYYMNIINTHCMFMVLETLIHDIPATCLAAEISVHFWGKNNINCWECTALYNSLQKEQSMFNSTLWLGLMLAGVGIIGVYKGLLPLYIWIGNPFSWSCYPLRFCLAMPTGIIYAVMSLTPCMGVVYMRVVPAVPALKAEVGGIASTIWSIGLVFWVLMVVMFIVYYCCKSTIVDLCPCLAWFEDPKSKKKDADGKAGCMCF